ncbi:MAG: carboxypeptidase regulatory-like domain-containing protein [Candidatus Sericytochromatia bacterium]
MLNQKHRAAAVKKPQTPARPAKGRKPAAPPPRPLWRRALLPGLGLLLGLTLLGFYLATRSATIVGRVTDGASQEPLRSASIQLDQSQAVTINDLTGSFIFNRVRPGPHSLKVQAAGHLAQKLDFTVRAGQTEQFLIRLPLAPVADRFAGRLAIVGTRNPAGIALLDAELSPLAAIGLDAWPDDAQALGGRLYLAESSRDQIEVVDLRQGKTVQKIPLPPFSGPMRLLLSPDQSLLLVLNAVGKNLTVIDTRSLQIRQTIALPLAATDMLLTGDGATVLAAGPEGLVPVVYNGALVNKVLPFAVPLKGGLKLLPGTSQVLLPGGDTFLLLDPFSGRSEEIALDHKLELIVGLDSSQVLIAGAGQVYVYNLGLRDRSGPGFVYQSGKAVSLSRFGDKWLLATQAPDALYLLDPKALPAARQLPVSGQPQFVREYTLPALEANSESST